MSSWGDVNSLMSAFRTFDHRGCHRCKSPTLTASKFMANFMSFSLWGKKNQCWIGLPLCMQIISCKFCSFSCICRENPTRLADANSLWFCAGGPHHCWGKASGRSWSSQMFTRLLPLILRTTSLKGLKGLCDSYKWNSHLMENQFKKTYMKLENLTPTPDYWYFPHAFQALPGQQICTLVTL